MIKIMDGLEDHECTSSRASSIENEEKMKQT